MDCLAKPLRRLVVRDPRATISATSRSGVYPVRGRLRNGWRTTTGTSFEANNGPAALIVEKEGYRLADGQTGSHGALTPIVNGDTRFDIDVLRH